MLLLGRYITFDEKEFCAACFVCGVCKKELAGLKFASKEGQAYCPSCYGDLFAKKCCCCTKPITGECEILT
jgi:LIM domain-containing protein 2